MSKSHSKTKSRPNKSKGQQIIFGPQANIFDRKQIVQKQNKLKKLYEAKKCDPATEYFSKIKYQFVIYSLGQYIQLYSLNPTESYIARLTQVIKIPGPQSKAFIEVEWVLKKNDLPEQVLKQYGQFISTAELFPSPEKIYLYVESIKNKCTVLDSEQYGLLGLTSEMIYYTRSSYDPETKLIKPNPWEWQTDCCECRKPNNPDLVYVECSKCARWFHNDCVQSKIINGHFMCDRCFTHPVE